MLVALRPSLYVQVVITALWWLALVVAILSSITPTVMVLRRSGTRGVPLCGSRAVRPPWWATALSFLGIPLYFVGARGLGGSANLWPYFFAAVGIAVVVQAGLVLLHNRHATSP